MASKSAAETLEQAFQRCRDLDASLADRLNAFAGAVERLTPEFAVAVDRLVERLVIGNAGSMAPRIGELMPDFILPDEGGRLVSLASLFGHGPVAVTIDRGHWCPYCRISIHSLARAHHEIAANGGQVVAIIPDRQRFARELKEDCEAPFSILTDLDNGYALSLNLAIWVGPEMELLMAARGRDLPTYHGNLSWMLPIPVTFVVASNRVITTRFVDPDYRKRMEIDDLTAAIRGVR